MTVFDRLRANRHEARRRVDRASGTVLATFQSRRDHQRFDARTGLEDVSDGAIAITRGGELRTIVGVVGWLIHHCQHFARANIEHDNGPGTCFIRFDRRLQRSVRKVLQPQVDACRELFAIVCRADTGDVLDGATQPVLQDAFGAGFTGKPVIKGELEPFLARVVDIGEANQVPCDLGRRVVTSVFALHADARQFQRQHPLCLFRVQVSLEVQEFLVHAASNSSHQRLRFDPERTRQLRHLVYCGGEFLGIDPDTVDRCTDRQRLAVSIGNRAAVRHDRFGTQVTRIGLAIQEVLVEYLQVHRACDQR